MTAENPQTNNSTTTIPSLDGGAGSVNSPRRLPAAWAQVVRGESDTAAATPSSPKHSPPPPSADSIALTGSGSVSAQDSGPGQSNVAAAAADETETASQVVEGTSPGGNNGNAGSQKKAAWNKPLNGAAAAAEVAITPVMGADSWPALSESTRPGPKSDASSSKPVSDASIPIPQAPVIAQTPHKQAKPNVNANTNHNHNHGHGQPTRQRSMKHRGNSSGGGNGGGGGAGGGSNSTGFARAPPPPTPPPLPPPFPLFEMPYGNMVPAAVLDSSQVRGEGVYKGGSTNSSWVARPMGHGVNDHSSHRRRGNFGGGGGRPRGDGPPYVNGYGGRHDQDQRDWHGPRGSNARDVHMPPHQMIPPPHAPRGLFRPPHLGAPPFMAPQAMRPFPGPMGFDIASQFLYLPTLPPEQFRGAPLIPHATPMFFPIAEPTLHTQIVNQIEYYFSEANLVKDNYLRSNMDDEGWVPVSLIAKFPRVQGLTSDIQLILDCLRTSTVVEVQGDKVRRRNDWRKWAPASGRLSAASSVQSPDGASDTSLQIALQKLTVEETTATDLKTALGSADTDTERVPIANGEVTTEACASRI